MKGDFSRGVVARPGVVRVLMQQGRVQLDADWNEAAAVADRRARLALGDLLGTAEPVGVAAVPRDHAGYGIAARGGYQFDGKAALRPAGLRSLGGRERFTIEATVAPRVGGRGGTIAGRLMLEHREPPRGEFALRVDAHGRPALLRVEDGHVRALIAPVALPFGEHTDVAAACDGKRVTLYVGGRLVAARDAGHGDHDEAIPLLIGAHAARDGVADGFDGVIDRLAISACEHRHHHRGERGGCVAESVTLESIAPDTGPNAPERLPDRLLASAGRAYVDGLLCEQDAEIELAVPHGASGTHLAYLEAWERLVSAAEDPTMVDPALGGIDTSVAVRTDARVRIAPLNDALARMHAASARGTMAFARDIGATPLGNQLVRVEVHRSGVAGESSFAYDDPRLVDATRVDAHTFRLARDAGWTAGQPVRLVASDGTMSAVAPIGLGDNGDITTDEMVPNGPFRVAPIATVKWSRDNGSVAFAIDATAEPVDRFTVADPHGRVAALRPAADASRTADVLEVLDASQVADGAPGRLVALADLLTDEPGETTAVLGATVGAIATSGVLRVWSSFTGFVEAAVVADAPITLAPGFTVTFSNGNYTSGDFWWTPVRDDVDGLWNWPQQNGRPASVAPAGVDRRFAPLALLEMRTGDLPSVVDLRRIVEPLADDGGDRLAPPAPKGAAPPSGDAPHRQHEHAHEHERTHERRNEHERERPHEHERTHEPERRHEHEHEHEREHEHEHEHGDEREHEHVVLSTREAAPDGFRFTGMTIAQRPAKLRWDFEGDAPRAGRAIACTAGDVIYALFDQTGELWARDTSRAAGERDGWRRCADRDAGSEGAALVVLDDVLYALGGLDGGRPHARCDAYDAANDAWTAVTPMRTARAFFGAAVLGDRIVVLGGVRRAFALGFAFASNRVESWTPGDARWRREPPLELRRQGCAAVGRGRRAYLIGGASGAFWANERGYGAAIDAVAPFDGLAWNRGSLATAQRDARAVLVDGELVVAGGRARHGDFAATERFAPGTDTGEPLPQLERIGPGLAAAGGSLYAIAGDGAVRADARVERCTLARPLFVHARER